MRPRLRHLLLPLAALPAAVVPAATAHADRLIAELARDTPIAAYRGVLAWSAYDTASGRYRLMIGRGAGNIVPARARTSARAFDVSLGPDRNGQVVALYTRCRTKATNCDIFRYSLVDARERKLGFSASQEDEAWPAQWRDRVAFVRRHPTGGRARSCLRSPAGR